MGGAPSAGQYQPSSFDCQLVTGRVEIEQTEGDSVIMFNYPIDTKAGFMIVTKWIAGICAAAFVWMRILEPMIFA